MIVELTNKTVGEFIKTGKAVVLAWGEGCRPCVDYHPEFEAVSNTETAYKFGSIKVERDSPSTFRRTYMVAKKIGEQIGTPMTFLFEDGKEVRRHYGIIHRDLLKQFLTQDITPVPPPAQTPQQNQQKDITKAPILEIQARGFTILQQLNVLQNEAQRKMAPLQQELEVIQQELMRRGVR